MDGKVFRNAHKMGVSATLGCLPEAFVKVGSGRAPAGEVDATFPTGGARANRPGTNRSWSVRVVGRA